MGTEISNEGGERVELETRLPTRLNHLEIVINVEF